LSRVAVAVYAGNPTYSATMPSLSVPIDDLYTARLHLTRVGPDALPAELVREIEEQVAEEGGELQGIAYWYQNHDNCHVFGACRCMRAFREDTYWQWRAEGIAALAVKGTVGHSYVLLPLQRQSASRGERTGSLSQATTEPVWPLRRTRCSADLHTLTSPLIVGPWNFSGGLDATALRACLGTEGPLAELSAALPGLPAASRSEALEDYRSLHDAVGRLEALMTRPVVQLTAGLWDPAQHLPRS
jgi:hypothetical protein